MRSWLLPFGVAIFKKLAALYGVSTIKSLPSYHIKWRERTTTSNLPMVVRNTYRVTAGRSGVFCRLIRLCLFGSIRTCFCDGIQPGRDDGFFTTSIKQHLVNIRARIMTYRV